MDHPRTCGEKPSAQARRFARLGSPPHMRGKGISVDFFILHKGITPAHAGKSARILWEHFENMGSPPHMRGKEFPFLFAIVVTRITPAHAGKSRLPPAGAHFQIGSPPHMRGKGCRILLPMCLYRITPAHAGKRLKRSRSIVPHAAIVPLFPSVCNKPAGSDGSPAGHDAPPFLPIENAAPASPAYNLRSL